MNVIACAPVRSMRDEVVPGSRVLRCAACRGPVWVSPAGQKMLQGKENQPYCVGPCAQERVEELSRTSGEAIEFRGVDGWEAEALPKLGLQSVMEIKKFLDALNGKTHED